VSEKRALIVDDSKSARVVLSRLLEKYDLAVDTSDSAEQALEYLKARRPDVIFMDHLMPGMDGLQAVQAIRNNPDTAAIPIMMYTSQEGELYLGQARALGATGVLPKKIGSSEVSRILKDLSLLADPTSAEAGAIIVAPPAAEPGAAPAAEAAPAVAEPAPGSATGAVAPAEPAVAPAAVPVAALADVLEPLLKQHSAELRRFVVASLDSFAARVIAETREQLRATAAVPAPVAVPVAPIAVEPPPAPAVAEEPPARPTGWIALALVALLIAAGAGALAYLEQRQVAVLVDRLAAVPAPSVPAPAAAPVAVARDPAPPAAAEPAAAPAIPAVPVPYGEPPLAGARIERLKALLADLEKKKVRATVTLTVHAGDFCLTGNPAEGYGLAPEDMAANRCDLVGNPFDDALRPAQRRAAAFDELVASVRARTDGALDVRVVDAARQRPSVAYPTGSDASAAQWNAAAAANHRVEYIVEPAPRT
jgi:CheY-like chemotaxis protein